MAGRLRDDGDSLSEAHEINVTPFIDVVLVLLIIFVVAAPLSTVNVPVELPVAVAKPAARPDDSDLQMAKPSPKRELQEMPKEDKTTQAIEQPPAPASVPVQETTAPAPSKAPPSTVAAAPQVGLSEPDKRIIARWQRAAG